MGVLISCAHIRFDKVLENLLAVQRLGFFAFHIRIAEARFLVSSLDIARLPSRRIVER